MDPESNHALDNFHSWFYSVIGKWLEMVQVKHHTRVAKCVDFDPLDRLDMHVPVRTSTSCSQNIWNVVVLHAATKINLDLNLGGTWQ